MAFAKLTELDASEKTHEIWVNPDFVIAFSAMRPKGGTHIDVFGVDWHCHVKESPLEVRDRLELAQRQGNIA